MKEITITINENDILSRLYSESGYAAYSRESMGEKGMLCDTVTVTEDNYPIIKEYIKLGLYDVVALISHHLSPCSIEHNGKNPITNNYEYLFKLNYPTNYPQHNTTIIKERTIGYTIARVLQEWSMLMKPDEANIHATRALENYNKLKEILSQREKPKNSNN